MRIYEAYKETKEVTLRFADKVRGVCLCDMLENEESRLSFDAEKVTFTIRPFEIITMKVLFDL